MTERANGLTISREPEVSRPVDDRRTSRDRRGSAGRAGPAGPAAAGRRGAPKRGPLAKWLGIAGRDLLLILGTVGAIVFSVRHVQPIFANQPSVAENLSKQVPFVRAALAPTPKDTSQLARLVASPQFEADRRNFAADLVRTGRMTQQRADSISFYAVREAYVRGIPPAVIFGVMLTENALFVSSAMSNVGAVGLMQVYPKVWLKALAKKFGHDDIASDSTNLKYGVYILSEYIKSNEGKVTQAELSKGLLKYNGCVRGTNTPHCKNYPSKVQSYVEKQAPALCGDKGFYECIAKPFVSGFFGKRESTK